MKSFDRRVHVALVAAGVMLFGARSASAWVAVRAPIARTVAVGVTAGAVAGSVARSSAYPYPSSSSTVVVTPPPAAPAPPAGMVTTLPPGCVSSGGKYQCGSVWYQPYFGGNGVYYQAIPPP